MKTNSLSRKPFESLLILIIVAVVLTGMWMIFPWNSFPDDDVREGITMAEAQSLVVFPVCVPTYIPPETDPNPIISFDADDANVPEVTYVRLRYKRTGAQDKIFEVYQRYTPDEGMKTAYIESYGKGAKASLVYWMITPGPLVQPVESILEQIQMEASDFHTDQTVWFLYKIVAPNKYRSTMTEWQRNHVEYRILSYLSPEEIQKVTLSMLECSTPTP